MNQLIKKSFLRRPLLAVAAFAGVAFSVPFANAQDNPYRYNPEHRRPIEATMHHLQEIAAHNTFSNHERERYDNAMRHLSQFADRLHERGHFDKDKLDQAIGDVQNIIDHNPMPEGAREQLRRDDNELRRLREHYDERYRYSY